MMEKNLYNLILLPFKSVPVRLNYSILLSAMPIFTYSNSNRNFYQLCYVTLSLNLNQISVVPKKLPLRQDGKPFFNFQALRQKA